MSFHLVLTYPKVGAPEATGKPAAALSPGSAEPTAVATNNPRQTLIKKFRNSAQQALAPLPVGGGPPPDG